VSAAWLDGVDALVFDLDGTLADTVEDLSAALAQALRACGLDPVPAALVRDTLHGGLSATAAAALDELDAPPERLPQLLAAYEQAYRERAHRASTAYAGVGPLLDDLARRGARMAICTNKDRAEARQLLLRLGLAHRFEVVVGGDTTGRRKPDPLPLLHALDLLDAEPPQALFFGDSEVDAACARAAGVRFVLHAAGYGVGQVPASLAWRRFGTYGELLARQDPAAAGAGAVSPAVKARS
jgi:phosphoglycolate phosphatase